MDDAPRQRLRAERLRISRRSASSRQRSNTPRTFHEELYKASITPANKPAPLYETDVQVRVRALEHMNIICLKRKLAQHAADMINSEEASQDTMDTLKNDLKEYVQALRDLKYILEPPSQNKRTAKFLRDQLYIRDTRDSFILHEVGLLSSKARIKPYLEVPNYTGDGGHSSRKDNAKQTAEGFLSRLKMALFGGLALIAPMLIMRLHMTLITQLVTTSVFVLVVGIVLAWYMKDANKKDILASTAAYAAVLVVVSYGVGFLPLTQPISQNYNYANFLTSVLRFFEILCRNKSVNIKFEVQRSRRMRFCRTKN
ncbi:hypothetical protein GLAREA_02173 [Glarea lozoyensis ATCC 20868]|uniref:DUF6594 domain-containing protein n=1 Tax=Glarea lozoyensis (strain ATCC 20868 / MF5171) TaxID=1116229 RepID=S3D2K3_GLAL2|nr:uncharacterized protein GLAREA_02173 [Glarea lozoyensis ATCC 20868]EPE26261.1 hypothetical protein GLAREA_02173 [Glarea lozoyensis ATCC 20868]